jgi:hypothetical protein
VADSDANQCVLDLVEKFGAIFNAARPSIDASDAQVSVLRESIRAARDRVEQAAAHDDVSIDPQWAATMRRQLDELNSIKRNTWDGRHAASLQAIETRKTALDREGLMWVVDESAALQANSVAIMEKERWRCVQLLKKKREAQRRVESARVRYVATLSVCLCLLLVHVSVVWFRLNTPKRMLKRPPIRRQLRRRMRR